MALEDGVGLVAWERDGVYMGTLVGFIPVKFYTELFFFIAAKLILLFYGLLFWEGLLIFMQQIYW